MKKVITIAFCIVLSASILSGCRGSKDKNTIDTTTTPSTMATTPSTHSATAPTDSTAPSESITTPSITLPESETIPSESTSSDVNQGTRSRAHHPYVVGKGR